MIATIRPSALNGTIAIPSSKSVMQRACALALLRRGKTIISNPGQSEDEQHAVMIIEALGAEVSRVGDTLEIISSGRQPVQQTIDCGESGLSTRMFSIISGLFDQELTFFGRGTLLNRRLDFPVDALRQLGVKYDTTNGYLPVRVHGPAKPISIEIAAPPGSQYLTGLLFLLAATVEKQVTLTVGGKVVSRPYIDLSLNLLNTFGFSVTHNNYTVYDVGRRLPSTDTLHYHVEADWSNAAFFVVAAAIAGALTLSGLDLNSSQGDKVILDVARRAGVQITIEGAIHIQKSPSLKAFRFDATDHPDLFPPLVALAVHCDGESVISGVSRLSGKESDRASTLIDAFTRLGADIICENDELRILGGSKLCGTSLSSYNDHRLVMSCSIAALRSSGATSINNAEAVSKSFPTFFEQLSLLGADVSLAGE